MFLFMPNAERQARRTAAAAASAAGLAAAGIDVGASAPPGAGAG